MTAVMAQARLWALRPGAGLFRPRRCPHHRYGA